MGLTKISRDRRRLADIVYDQLVDAIQSGSIAADERLVQEKLADELQISRTPIREALLRLEQDGILVSSPRGGFLIHNMTDQEVRELYQARAAIEGQAMRILATMNDPEKNADLRETINREENISSPSISAYFEANRNIHRRFLELSGNRYLTEMFDNIWNRGVSYNLFAAIDRLDLSKSFGDHVRLVDAIETGDVTLATDAITDHVKHGYEMQIEALNKDTNS